jgi:hypothetical protein
MVGVKLVQRNKFHPEQLHTIPPFYSLQELWAAVAIHWHDESLKASDSITWWCEYSSTRWHTLADGFKSNKLESYVLHGQSLCWHSPCIYRDPAVVSAILKDENYSRNFSAFMSNMALKTNIKRGVSSCGIYYPVVSVFADGSVALLLLR